MARPMLLHGSERWVNTNKDYENKDSYRETQAAEIKFLRRVKGCTRKDAEGIECIRFG